MLKMLHVQLGRMDRHINAAVVKNSAHILNLRHERAALRWAVLCIEANPVMAKDLLKHYEEAFDGI